MSFQERDCFQPQGADQTRRTALLATVVRADRINQVDKTEFFTEVNHPLQVGVLNVLEGEVKNLHVHPSIGGEQNLQEFWLVLTGTVTLILSDSSGIIETRLGGGDLALIHGGPHGLKAETDSRILVVKQGEGVLPEKNFLRPRV